MLLAALAAKRVAGLGVSLLALIAILHLYFRIAFLLNVVVFLGYSLVKVVHFLQTFLCSFEHLVAIPAIFELLYFLLSVHVVDQLHRFASLSVGKHHVPVAFVGSAGDGLCFVEVRA